MADEESGPETLSETLARQESENPPETLSETLARQEREKEKDPRAGQEAEKPGDPCPPCPCTPDGTYVPGTGNVY